LERSAAPIAWINLRDQEALVIMAVKFDPDEDLTDAEYLRRCVFLQSGIELPLDDPQILAAVTRPQNGIAPAQATKALYPEAQMLRRDSKLPSSAKG
jgi:hypothetical protein